MASLKGSLEKIGEPEPNMTYKLIPSEFYSFPQSLKAGIKAMDPPLIEEWTLAHVDSFFNQDWTEECQGVTTDGQFWYIVSNNHHKRAVYKFSYDFNLIQSTLFLGDSQIGNHIGQPACDKERIFVPVEGGDKARVWVLDTNLGSLGIFDLGGDKQGNNMPWCAINPWNGFLYSSIYDNGNVIFAYDPNTFEYKVGKDLCLKGNVSTEIQGGCFSENGHLFLSSESSEDISAYSALNGMFLGSCNVPYDKDTDEEMEGMTLGHIKHEDGISTYVHVIILDNDDNPDDVYFKHFAVPNPLVL